MMWPSTSTDLNYCPYCGEQLTSPDSFCPYCGQELTHRTAVARELHAETFTLRRIYPELAGRLDTSDAPQSQSDAPVAYDPEVSAEIQQLTQSLGENAPNLKTYNYKVDYSYEEALNNLIGMESVKKTLKSQIDTYTISHARQQQHPDLPDAVTFHCIFVGNPGTGKTTVARILGGLFRSKGLLKSGHCVEVSAGDLLPGWVGVGARIAKLAVLQAMDGVLFIDEAYALGKRMTSNGNLGDEVMDELTKLIEDYRDRFVVVMAGYDKEMKEFINQTNTGFRSRFNATIHFPDYTADEMYCIFAKIVEQNYFKMEPQADKQIREIFQHIAQVAPRLSTFANARTVRQVFETVRGRASTRMVREGMEHCDINLLKQADMQIPAEEIKNILGE